MTRTDLNEAVNARVAQIEETLAPLSDETAVEVAALFPTWIAGAEYEANERIQYDGKLYRCVQTHFSQAGWEPPNVPALWTEIAKPSEIPVWKQPSGAQDAYMKGNKVHYPLLSSPVYESTVDNNVWSPDVYGWQLMEG